MKQTANNQDKGAVMILVALLITAIIGVIALVIDSSRQQLSMRQLQNAADAAAIAGANHLDGSPTGWKQAKRAVVAALREGMIYGAEQGMLDISFDPALLDDSVDNDLDPNEQGPKYKGTVAQVGNLQISVRRGVYWSSPGPEEFEFTPLEGESHQIVYHLPAHLIANAVQVSIEVANVPTFFARVFGVTDYDLAAKAVALMDREIEADVAPIAIPACSLLLDTNVFAAASDRRYLDFETATYEAKDQCKRQVVATEADRENEYRSDGITRAESYPRLPYYYFSPPPDGSPTPPPILNYRAIPIDGVLGIPGNGDDGPINGTDVANAFKPEATRRARLGQQFRPLDRAVSAGLPDTGFLNNAEVEKIIARFISASDMTYESVFTAGSNPDGTVKERPNYPHLRSDESELPIVWPLGEGKFDTILMAPMGPQDWSDPMCHSGQLPFNTPSAPVKQLTVMVIAPTLKTVNYCDFNSVFDGSEQSSFPPLHETNPVIVGFVRAYLYDFNILSLAETPRYGPPGGAQLVDVNPGRLPALKDYSGKDFGESYRQYRKDHKDWEVCHAIWEDCANCQVCPSDCKPNCPPCLPVCPPPEEPVQPLVPEISEDLRQCFYHPRVDDQGVIRPRPDEPDEKACEECIILQPGEPCEKCPWGDALPDIHCFPKKKDNCFPEDKKECWEQIKPRESQYGCGGLRLALDCEPAAIPMTRPLSLREPALIESGTSTETSPTP